MILKLSNTYRLVLSLRTKTKCQASSSVTAQTPTHGTARPHSHQQLLRTLLNQVVSGLDHIDFGHPQSTQRAEGLQITLLYQAPAAHWMCRLCLVPTAHAQEEQAEAPGEGAQPRFSDPAPPLCFQGRGWWKGLICFGVSRSGRLPIVCSSSRSRATELH